MGTTIPKLIFNHPFIFFLRNTETGDILFAGRMSEPDAARQPVLGAQSESEQSKLTQIILTPIPAAGVSASITVNPASYNSNTYNPSLSAGGIFNTNLNPAVPQIQPTTTNHYSSPNNLNNRNNFPSSVASQSYARPVHSRSTSNYPTQSNTAQYQPHSNSEMYHVSNPDTIGTQYGRAPVILSSTSGSYASFTNSAQYPSDVNNTPQESGVRDKNQNDRIHFSP
jgi:hypothetical protein